MYLVEDSPLIRTRVIESLSESGTTRVVGFADTENEALNGIQDAKPDADVLDIQLRRGNGLNLLRRLRSLNLEYRPLVIMLTNYDNPEYRQRAMAAGSDYFFDKASQFHRLSEVLDDIAG